MHKEKIFDVDLFDDLMFQPAFDYGTWTNAGLFPYIIDFRYSKSLKHLRANFLFKTSNKKWAICDLHNLFHIVNPSKFDHVFFIDSQNMRKFEGSYIFDLLTFYDDKSVAYSTCSTFPDQITLSVDNIYCRNFTRTPLGKFYFSDYINYLDDFRSKSNDSNI